MSYDKGDDEAYWKYLKRKLPLVYEALYKIKGLKNACHELFGVKRIFWDDEQEDFSNKLLIGLLKQELDEHIRIHEEIEGKIRIIKENELEWSFAASEGDTIILMNNLHQHAKIPSFLFLAIKLKKKIDCTIDVEGDYFHYRKTNKTLGKVPKSLQLQIVRNNVKGLPKDFEELNG